MGRGFTFPVRWNSIEELLVRDSLIFTGLPEIPEKKAASSPAAKMSSLDGVPVNPILTSLRPNCDVPYLSF